MANTMNAHDSSNQVLFTASAMFAAIVAAVVVSTLLVMTLMKGEFASAVSEIQNNPTTSQVAQVSSDDAVCTGSYSSEAEGDEASRASLYKSKDGMNWEAFFSIPVKASNEVALDTGTNGELYALVRQEISPNHPLLLIIEDPVNKPGIFELESLPFPLQGPFIKRMNARHSWNAK